MRIINYIWSFLFLICINNAVLAIDASYTITPNLSASQSTIRVQLEVKTNEDGVASLVYFDEAWGEQNLFNCLQSLEVLNSKADIKIDPETNSIIIKSLPRHLLLIEYVLKQDFDGEANISDYYRPIINKEYFHLFGHRLFLIPDKIFKSKNKNTIEINWEEVPYLVQHNFGTESEGVYYLTRDELLESVVVGGDFRRHSVNFNGINLHLLTRGSWKSFDDEELLQKLERIVHVQRDFWNDYSDDIYTVTLLPFDQNGGNYLGGTGLANGFASYCTNSKKSKLENLSSLYYHELMHHWIGGKIRNSSPGEELWFSEGFTEYFSMKLILQQNEMTQKEFDQEIQRTYEKLEESPYGKLRNNELSLTTNNSQIEEIPYQRGLLYAHYLDEKLQAQSDGKTSLKDVMLQILSDTENKLFTNQYFEKILLDFFDQEEQSIFNNYILKGELVLNYDFAN
ncbi:M1 family aminopeptidase [Portibacter lacus]|uniref:Peptidase M1 membrane alanine aminopeptidase domain-containing protein n=1 Tax=Portibacter lacus TaxID=1099794 RepID=A0AA37WGL0_9BACT|nr:M1 family aminopeptidase [Portibacter lacus]GLR20142.1 hypothetical protein GCM10007940_47580 [Portibacter lacus]